MSATPYRIFGSEMSPYSVKVRAYFRYKNIPHVWISRNAASDEAYRRFAKLPIVPTVATPEDEGLQDSTPIIEHVEARFPEPSIHPEDSVLRFLSILLEEFGDEWGNKLMFHHRWYDDLDQRAASLALSWLADPTSTPAVAAARAAIIRERMTGRGHFVGSSPETAPLISAYWFALIDILEPHLATRRYLFGARPAFADFGLAAQLYEAAIDPTCGASLRARAPSVLAWCYRMLDPSAAGAFETWSTLAPTLEPLLAYVGRYFLPWSEANAKALAGGETSFSVRLAGQDYVQGPQKYHAKSLSVLKGRWREASSPDLDRILDAAACLSVLKS